MTTHIDPHDDLHGYKVTSMSPAAWQAAKQALMAAQAAEQALMAAQEAEQATQEKEQADLTWEELADLIKKELPDLAKKELADLTWEELDAVQASGLWRGPEMWAAAQWLATHPQPSPEAVRYGRQQDRRRLARRLGGYIISALAFLIVALVFILPGVIKVATHNLGQ